MNDLYYIKKNKWNKIYKLYVNIKKNNKNELFAIVLSHNDKVSDVAFGPIIYTKYSEVYSRLVKYEKVIRITEQFQSFNIVNNKLYSIPKNLDSDVINICYKYICLMYNNVFKMINIIPESSFVYSLFREKSLITTDSNISALYDNDIKCCLKITYTSFIKMLNIKLSNFVKNNISLSFPLIYHSVGNILIFEQIGPTFPAMYTFDEIFLDHSLFSSISNIDKILFEYIYGLYCINKKLNIYHGDLHLNNITIFERGIKNVAYKLEYIDQYYIFKNCFKIAGILDISKSPINIKYFNTTFKTTLHKKKFTNIEILKLCSITDTYHLLCSIKTYLLSKQIINHLFVSRISNIIDFILLIIKDPHELVKTWPNYNIINKMFDQYLSSETTNCHIVSCCSTN